MAYSFFILGAVKLGDLLKSSAENDVEHKFQTQDLIIVAGAAVVIGLILVLWLVFFRKRPDGHERPEPRRRAPVVESREHTEKSDSADPSRRRRRRRRRRRDHRPRNATLEQTGGLPPPRPEDQPPPF